jgi:hypothetical protein
MIHFLMLVRSPTRVDAANSVSADTCAFGSTLPTGAGLASPPAGVEGVGGFDGGAPGWCRAGRLARFGGIARRNCSDVISLKFRERQNGAHLSIELPVHGDRVPSHQRRLDILFLFRHLLSPSFLILRGRDRRSLGYGPLINDHRTPQLIPRRRTLIALPLSARDLSAQAVFKVEEGLAGRFGRAGGRGGVGGFKVVELVRGRVVGQGEGGDGGFGEGCCERVRGVVQDCEGRFGDESTAVSPEGRCLLWFHLARTPSCHPPLTSHGTRFSLILSKSRGSFDIIRSSTGRRKT